MPHKNVQIHENFASKYLPRRNIEVWLPPNYETESSNYPVIYMHDGMSLFNPETSFMGADWGIHEAMMLGIENGTIPAAIIVGIWTNENRMGEYMPQAPFEDAESISNLDMQYQTLDPNTPPINIVSDNYLKFIVEELKPFIDQQYRVIADQASTHIMGGSMGGLISLYAICEYPDLFNGAACVSTHWPLDDGEMLSYFKSHIPTGTKHKVYLDYGDEALENGYLASHEKIKKELLNKSFIEGKNYLEMAFPGHAHSEEFFRKRVHFPLEFLLSKGLPK